MNISFFFLRYYRKIVENKEEILKLVRKRCVYCKRVIMKLLVEFNIEM